MAMEVARKILLFIEHSSPVGIKALRWTRCLCMVLSPPQCGHRAPSVHWQQSNYEAVCPKPRSHRGFPRQCESAGRVVGEAPVFDFTRDVCSVNDQVDAPAVEFQRSSTSGVDEVLHAFGFTGEVSRILQGIGDVDGGRGELCFFCASLNYLFNVSCIFDEFDGGRWFAGTTAV